MSADEIPYQLRPNKFIDRELFIDLLSRILPDLGAEKYVYVSMGGKHLVDHTAIYRRVGINKLYSFDADHLIVSRQTFNRPIDSAICSEMHSSNLAGALDSILAEFPAATNAVIWLDYTDPHARLAQLQEVVEVSRRLQPGDIIRITMNSNIGTLEGNSSAWKENGFATPGEYRATRFKDQMDEFAPNDLQSIGENELPATLAAAISLAFAKAESLADTLKFSPALLTTYKDGQRMMTATVKVLRSTDPGVINGIGDWHFAAKGWNNLIEIAAPDLSLREKLKLDELLSKPPEQVLKALGFLFAGDVNQSVNTINNYVRLHRYYPAFHNIDV